MVFKPYPCLYIVVLDIKAMLLIVALDSFHQIGFELLWIQTISSVLITPDFFARQWMIGEQRWHDAKSLLEESSSVHSQTMIGQEQCCGCGFDFWLKWQITKDLSRDSALDETRLLFSLLFLMGIRKQFWSRVRSKRQNKWSPFLLCSCAGLPAPAGYRKDPLTHNELASTHHQCHACVSVTHTHTQKRTGRGLFRASQNGLRRAWWMGFSLCHMATHRAGSVCVSIVFPISPNATTDCSPNGWVQTGS